MYRSAELADDAFRQYFFGFIREREQTASESSAPLSQRIDGLFVRLKQRCTDCEADGKKSKIF